MSSKPSRPQPQAGPGLIKLSFSSASNSFVNSRSKGNRRFLVISAFLLICALLLGSILSLLGAYSSGILTLNSQVHSRKVFTRTGKTSLITASSTVQVLHARAQDKAEQLKQYKDQALRCDRSHYRTDVCVAQGDVRVASRAGHGRRRSYQVVVFAEDGRETVETVKPYTRKWEGSVMSTIDEVKVIRKPLTRRRMRESMRMPVDVADAGDDQFGRNPQKKKTSSTIKQRVKKRGSFSDRNDVQVEQKKRLPYPLIKKIKGDVVQLKGEPSSTAELVQDTADDAGMMLQCEVQHEEPAILFSTGGYTGNVYHEFNDGLIPLFITAQRYTNYAPAGRRRGRGQVVLLVLEFHSWWMSKYAEVVAQITNYAIVDLARDPRVHCFPEVTVGLSIHDELSIDAQEQDHGASMEGFQALLRAAYAGGAGVIRSTGINSTTSTTARPAAIGFSKQPKLVIISRKRSRVLANQKEVIELARQVGFAVQVLSPRMSTQMVDLYRVLSGCDAMLGVHGAAMTHLLFMRSGATLIQVVPLGTDWAADTYYGEPARKLGLRYVGYKVSPRESSLWGSYASDDPVLVNPDSVNSKGWWETKRIYLEGQNVTVSLPNMAVILRSVYAGSTAAATARLNHPNQPPWAT